MVLVAAYFGYNSTHQLYANVELNEKRSKVVSTPKKVNEEEFQELYLRLQAYMSDKKPYLDEDLSLSGLAEQLGVKPNKLSNILKSQAKVNFYTYINGFRIEQIKKELVSTKEQVIIIAYNNGFKSKSTFNKVFKDFTGVSPTAYRRNKTE